MSGRTGAKPRHPSCRALLVEVLEDRLLLSSGLIPSGPGVAAPANDHALPALAGAPGGFWSAGAPRDAWAGKAVGAVAVPTGDLLEPEFAGPAAGAFAYAPAGFPPAHVASIPATVATLSGPWPGQPWAEVWADARPVLPESLARGWFEIGEPAPGSEVRTDAAARTAATPAASPGSLPAAEVRTAGSAALSGTAGAVPAAPALPAATALPAALAAKEASTQASSAEVRGPRTVAAREPSPTAALSLAPLVPPPGIALAPAAGSMLWGAAKAAEIPGVAALLPGSTPSFSGRAQATLPGAAGSSAGNGPPAGPSLAVSVSYPADRLDVLEIPANAAGLLEQGLPLKLQFLKEDVEAFLARLVAPAGAEGGWHGYARLVPWAVLLSAAAFEFAHRWWKRPTPPGPAARDEAVLGPLAYLPEEEP
jgi:hypothetical protein